MARRSSQFQTIQSEGGLLPPDVLRRLLDPRVRLEGSRDQDYGLPDGERLTETITQSWNRLRKQWGQFSAATADVPEGQPGTGLTNELWTLVLLRELGFGILPAVRSPEIGGRTYAINRFFGPVPVHLVGLNVDLDKRSAGVRGAAAANPHGLVQELLNRSPDYLWAILSNGMRLRILRDSQALSRQCFLEFDLKTMFEGEVYSDFVVLWLVAHATRFAPREAGRPETCWLEEWTKLALEQGTRALGDLREGVEQALRILGQGFTSHPRNTGLREALRGGAASPGDFHGQLLRLVYRLIFLFVAEDRTIDGKSLLHPPDNSKAAEVGRDRYAAHYSTSRLREVASRIKGSGHGDLWQQFRLVAAALAGDESNSAVRDSLALPALGSFLWDPASTTALNQAELTNHDFLEALRNLAFTRQGKVLRPVDYRNLGAEELGGVYESLLGLTPQVSADGAGFSFAEFAGSERKTTGSYYTPDSLVRCLLDSALDPVVEEAVKGKTGPEAEKAILGLKVCDPAAGSGHFLVGAAHRLARHLARVRAVEQGESEPSPLLYQQALRDVISHCLYAVDLNPMAAELCRVNLWLESLEPGKPLSFLDHHVRVGNSLLGTTPELIAPGLPDDAFKPIGDDDKKVCSELKKRNKQERKGQQDMVHAMVRQPRAECDSIEARMRSLDQASDSTIDEVGLKEEQFKRLLGSLEYQHAKLVADTWCSAFVWKKQAGVACESVTTDTIRRPQTGVQALTVTQRQEVERLSDQYQFFHWHLAFPDVFAGGGFDCVLGNPPWEHTELKEKEWFAERCPEIASARTGAVRKRMIEELEEGDPSLYGEFARASRHHDGVSHFLGNSQRFPFCGRGRINLYAVFAECMRDLLNERGRMGSVLPTGIATDDTTKYFFQDVIETKSLVSLFDFENKGVFFPGVHSSYKFCLFTSGRGVRPTAEAAEFVFFAHAVEDLRDRERRFTLSCEEIALLNPNTHTCPIFRSRRDAELTKAIYRRVPVLIREPYGDRPEENPWGITFKQGLFNMTSDSHLFRTREQLEGEGWQLEGNVFRKLEQMENNESREAEYLPLYEGRLVFHFDHRYSTHFNGEAVEVRGRDKANPEFVSLPRYWVPAQAVMEALGGRTDRNWLVGWRYISRSTDERSEVQAIFPVAGASNMFPLIFLSSTWAALLHSADSASFVHDFAVRQKMGGPAIPFFIKQQFCFVRPRDANQPVEPIEHFVERRAIELVYTAWDLEPFARDHGSPEPPFRWDEERRFLLRCELDAAFFHFYLPATPDGQWKLARIADGRVLDESDQELAALKHHLPTPRDAADYIMETFPIVKRKDLVAHGTYRTKATILDIYDRIQAAIASGTEYQTLLNPPPADPRCCHPPRSAADRTEG